MRKCLRVILTLIAGATICAVGLICAERSTQAADNVPFPALQKKAPSPGIPAPVLPKLCPVLPGPVLLNLKCATELEKKEEEEKKCDDPDLTVTPAELMKALKKGPDVKIDCKPNGNGKNGNGKKNGNGEEEEEEEDAGFDRHWGVVQQG